MLPILEVDVVEVPALGPRPIPFPPGVTESVHFFENIVVKFSESVIFTHFHRHVSIVARLVA
jgi:hypothetical protein